MVRWLSRTLQFLAPNMHRAASEGGPARIVVTPGPGVGENTAIATHRHEARPRALATDAPKEDLMKSRTLLTLAMVTLVASPALASFGSKPDTPPPSSPSSSSSSPEASGQKTP